MGRLEGKVALITGAARGQGRSHAVGLAAEGADIVAIDICSQINSVEYPMATPADLEETVRLVENQDRRIVAVQGDVRDLKVMQDLVTRAVAELGGVDIVLANAGIAPNLGVHGDTEQSFYDCIDVMLTGVWHTIRAAVPTMIDQGRGGSIIITSSVAGIRGVNTGVEAASAGYGAAKHGVVGLMRVYANLLGPHRIRVNTVHPTGVNTPMAVNESVSRFADQHSEMTAVFQNVLPVPLVEPEDVTSAIVWLSSDDARYITGVTLPVDAGITVRP